MKKKLTVGFMATLAAILMPALMNSCAEEEIEKPDQVTIKGLDGDVEFEYADNQPYVFTILSNKTWSVERTSLDWLEITPKSGYADEMAKVTLVPSDNTDVEREGVLIVYSGMQKKVVKVRQAGAPIIPSIAVTGHEMNVLNFAAEATASVSLNLTSNVAWTLTTSGLDGWCTVSPLAGDPGTASVTVTPQANTVEQARQGTITFSAEGAESVVITVLQAAYVVPEPPVEGQETLLAGWSAASTLTDNISEWKASGLCAADQGNANARMSFVIDSANSDLTYAVGSDQTNPDYNTEGFYTLRKVWTNDRVEFEVPVENMSAGSEIIFRCGLRTSQHNRFWNLEYWDNEKWNLVDPVSYATAGGNTQIATFDIGKANTLLSVEKKFVLATAATTLKIRLVAANGAYGTKNDSNAVPNGTVRLYPVTISRTLADL